MEFPLKGDHSIRAPEAAISLGGNLRALIVERFSNGGYFFLSPPASPYGEADGGQVVSLPREIRRVFHWGRIKDLASRKLVNRWNENLIS